MIRKEREKLTGAIRRRISTNRIKAVNPKILTRFRSSVENLIIYCLSIKEMKPKELEEFVKRSKE